MLKPVGVLFFLFLPPFFNGVLGVKELIMRFVWITGCQMGYRLVTSENEILSSKSPLKKAYFAP